MAKKRMFNLSVIDTDAFLDMPLSAQALYFHLNLRADDDGFVGNPKRIAQTIGTNIDDLRLLIAKRFLIAFEDGVIVIKHWRMHNVIKRDRYTETNFTDDLKMLDLKENGSYTLKDAYRMERKWSTNGAQMENSWSANGAQMSQTCSADIGIGIGKDIDIKYIPSPDGEEVREIVADDEYRFEEFWKKYPKKVDKIPARRAFKKKCVNENEFQAIMTGLDAWLKVWKEPQYIPYPSKWLNNERYKENPVTTQETESDPYGFLPFH